MNIFSYYGQRENHCTNILMNLLTMNNAEILNSFLTKLIPDDVSQFTYKNVQLHLFNANPLVENKQFEYVIGIAPFLSKIPEENVIPNPGSIPDAWVIGENFKLLFEFKITGTLNAAQFEAHREKMSLQAKKVEVTWKHVVATLLSIEAEGTMKWLIDQFCIVISDLESPKPASGMPKQITRRRKAQSHEAYFIISGNKRVRIYTVDLALPNGERTRILSNGTGIQASRLWIQSYIKEKEDSTIYVSNEGEVIDCCINPDRKNPEWNRWPLESM